MLFYLCHFHIIIKDTYVQTDVGTLTHSCMHSNSNMKHKHTHSCTNTQSVLHPDKQRSLLSERKHSSFRKVLEFRSCRSVDVQQVLTFELFT